MLGNNGFKAPLQQDISEPISYFDLVYKSKKGSLEMHGFLEQFKKIIKRYKRVVYTIDFMRQSACLVIDPIAASICDFFLNYMAAGKISD